MGTADVAIGLPHLGLCSVVRRYVGYRMGGFPPGVHRGLPSRYLTFLISIGRPIEALTVPAGSHLPPSLQALVGGLQTGPTVVRHDGNGEGIAVELSPVGARSLFGLPAVELTSHVVDLADLLGAAGRGLPERLAQTRDWPSRFRRLDEVLCGAARSGPAPGGGQPVELRHLPGYPAAMTTPAQHEHSAQPSADREPARRPEDLSRFFIERANAGDLEGLVALYEPDAVLALPTGDVARGEQAIRDAFQPMLTGQPVFTAAHGRPALLNGDLALTWTRPPDGATAEIARRQPDGAWLWTVDQPYILA